ncbi:MAG: GNAT family N-acetyltransferase [Candidatus Wallacebacter cryptica]|jgi:predicted GNAT family acetyltransferase|nr:hypothetical protein [Bacillota bacterium]
MRVIWHANIDTFLQESLAYLEQDEALNNLMLGISLRIQKEPNYYPQVEKVTVHKNGELVLAALMTVPEKLIIYGAGDVNGEALETLADSILERKLNLPGVIGPKEWAQKFADIWSSRTNCPVRLEINLRVYKLCKVNPDVIGAGRLRSAGSDDVELLARWIAEFQKDTALEPNPDLEKCRLLAERFTSGEPRVFFWEHNGKPVSVAAKSRSTRNGATVNLVYTPRELRGRGYASSCVASLSQMLLDSGYQFCSLFADLDYPTSNKIYQSIGYRPVGDFGQYRFETRS